jgi:RHS repeat-associated protein
VRKNPNETIEATYAYTYDAGDNLLTKVEPFEDDFNDGNYTGWTVTSGSWTAANNYMEATHATSTNVIRKAHTDADNEIVLRYRINDTSSNSAKASIHCRHVDGSNLIAVEIQPDRLRLVENVSGTGTVQDLNTSATSSEDVWYNLRIEAVGGDVTVWRWADGELAAQVLEMTGATIDTTSTCLIAVNPSYDYDFDDIRILSDDLSNTTTFAVNNSNELTAMADYNGSTTFGFDDWGRMTSKARGSYEATYAYRYGQMLRSVTSDFPGEGNVTYEYGGNGKRRQSIVSGSTTNYNWSGGRAIINIEDGSGNLTRTFIGHLRAHVDGSSPSTADYVYYSNDIIYTSRTMRGESRELLGQSEYDPYGGTLLHVGTSSSRGYTGQITDHETGLVLAPIRAYNAELARWLSRDTRQFAPANLYGYVGNSPVAFMDPMGWDAKGPEDYVHPEDVDVCANAWEASRMWPNPWKFKDKVRTGGDWDFKQRSPDERFEDFGNWHYGVVCRAWRFSRARCKKEAGRNHEERRKREGLPPLDGADRESGKLTPPNYGDDPNDQKNIDEGMDWFEEGNCDDYFERKLWEKMPDLIDGGWGR